MRLISNTGMVSSSLFSHALVFRDALLLRGRRSVIIRGVNAHLFLPWLFFELLPDDLLQDSREPKLLAQLPRPLQIYAQSVSDEIEGSLANLEPLGRALTYPIPRKETGGQWFLMETRQMIAVHSQRDFWFITRCPNRFAYHLKFASQSYVLHYAEEDDVVIWDALCRYFPRNPGQPNSDEEKNVFSNITVPTNELNRSRFPRFIGIFPIEDSELATSEISHMPAHLRPGLQKFEEAGLAVKGPIIRVVRRQR